MAAARDHRHRIRSRLASVGVVVVALAGLAACQPAGSDCDPAIYRRGADLAGTDQRNKQLLGCDLSQIDFTGADFTGADLGNVNLQRSTLDDATFAGADLHNARLDGASVESTHLATADLLLVASGGLTGVPADLPPGWRLEGGLLVGPHANLTSRTLDGLDLRGANLRGAFFMRSLVVRTDLSDADLTGANLHRTELYAELDGADLTDADLRGIISGGITGTPAALPPGWFVHAGRLLGPDADLTAADFRGHDLSGADLSRANLSYVFLDGAVLDRANLSHAILERTFLTGASIDGVDLSSATILYPTTGGLTGTPAALPAGYEIRDGWLLGPYVAFVGLDLTDVDLVGIDLTGVDLSGSDLTDVPGPGNGTAASAQYDQSTICADGNPAPFADDGSGWSCAGIGAGW